MDPGQAPSNLKRREEGGEQTFEKKIDLFRKKKYKTILNKMSFTNYFNPFHSLYYFHFLFFYF